MAVVDDQSQAILLRRGVCARVCELRTEGRVTLIDGILATAVLLGLSAIGLRATAGDS